MNVIALDLSTESPSISGVLALVFVTSLVVYLGFAEDLSTLMATAGGVIANRVNISMFNREFGKHETIIFCGLAGGILGTILEQLFPHLTSLEGLTNILF